MKNVFCENISPSPYQKNATMKMLGKNYYTWLSEEVSLQLDEILEARKFSSSRDMAFDVFMLGYIHGKRAERAKRKKHAELMKEEEVH